MITDVSGDITAHSAGSAQEVAFAQQLAHTGAARDTVGAVQLWVQGTAITELWGHLDWSHRSNPIRLPSHRSPSSKPAAGPGELTFPVGEVIARGEAQVVDARFAIRLYGPHGELVTDDVVTASATAPERGTWQHTLTIPGPGTDTVDVQEDHPADGERRPPFISSRSLEVAGDELDYSLPGCSDAAEANIGRTQDTDGNQPHDPDGTPVEVDSPRCIEETKPSVPERTDPRAPQPG